MGNVVARLFSQVDGLAPDGMPEVFESWGSASDRGKSLTLNEMSIEEHLRMGLALRYRPCFFNQWEFFDNRCQRHSAEWRSNDFGEKRWKRWTPINSRDSGCPRSSYESIRSRHAPYAAGNEGAQIPAPAYLTPRARSERKNLLKSFAWRAQEQRLSSSTLFAKLEAKNRD
jgi:hypothetical protein